MRPTFTIFLYFQQPIKSNPMFSLFRQIRRNLLSTNRVGKYLLYAIGEILLVVIGILIALQINTWNAERTLRAKELSYLREIRTNLLEDQASVEYNINFNKQKDSIIQASLIGILKSESDLDAMNVIARKMPLLAEYNVFTQNRIAFDNMVSAENIDLITRDSLRIMLSSYYSERNILDGTQERVKDLTRNFVDNISPLLMNREAIQQFLGMDNNFESGQELNFATNRTIFSDLFSMQRTLDSHTSYLMRYEQLVVELIGRIDDFLKETD